MYWDYVNRLTVPGSIHAFEWLTGYKFPKEFRDCAILNNGGRPRKRAFGTDAGMVHEVKAFLSFNKEDKETVWDIFNWNKQELKGLYIPFAIDNFGNLICFDRDGKVVFLCLETGQEEHVADSFKEFLDNLY